MIWMALRKVSDRVRYIHDSLALTYVGRPVMSGSIHEAARDGNVEELNNLMAQGVDVNSRDKLSRTPLHLAAWAGQVRPHVLGSVCSTAVITLICVGFRKSASRP